MDCDINDINGVYIPVAANFIEKNSVWDFLICRRRQKHRKGAFMLNRKVIVFIMIGVLTCFSAFGQDVAAVKKFERARRTIPVSISLNIFGFGIGSFIQGDTKTAFIQLGVSIVGYALLLPGIFGDSIARANDHDYMETGFKNTLIGLGSALLTGNMILGIICPVMYQFDEQFDAFYDVNNESKWPGGF
jgi:hypothetical protein